MREQTEGKRRIRTRQGATAPQRIHPMISAASVFLALFMALGVESARTQEVPSQINFQGRLTDLSNNPLDGFHDFVFKIYDTDTGGSPLWAETQGGVAVANGILSVRLGSLIGLTPAVFSADRAYLEITVDGVTLAPRERLISVPYAVNARRLQGRDFEALVSTDAAQTVAGFKTFSGGLQIGQASASTFSSAGHLTLANLSAAPAAAKGRIFYDPSGDGSFKVSLDGINFVRLATGTAGGGMYAVTSDAAQFGGDGNILTPLTLKPSSVTLQGNLFNLPDRLVRLDGQGKLPPLSADTPQLLDASVTDAKVAPGISQSKVTNLTNDLAARPLKAGDTFTGDLQVGAVSATTVSAAGFLTLANLGTAPGAAKGRLFFDPSGDGALRLSLDGLTYVRLATGTAGGGMSAVTPHPSQFSGDGNFLTPLTLQSSSVTLQGNVFNSANRLLRLDNSGMVPLGNLSNITDAQIAPGANIIWSKIDKTGSSLLDFATRDIADLTGNLPAARVSAGTFPFNVIASSVGASKVGTEQLADASITTPKLGDAQVTDSKVAAGISQSKITNLPADLASVGSDTATLRSDVNLRLLKGGDSMTGPLTLYASTLTIRGDAFSVGVSTLAVSNGRLGVGTSDPALVLDVNGAAQFGSAAKSTFSASGALSIASGQGIAVAGGGELTGLPGTPSGATAAASKAYVDSLTGGTGASIYASSKAWSAQQDYLNQLTISTDAIITGVLNRNQALTIGSPGVLAGIAGDLRVAGRHDSIGDLQVGDLTASTLSASGYLTLANLSGAPANAPGRLYYDSTGDGALKVRLNSGGFVSLATGTVAGASNVSKSGDYMTGPLTLYSSTLTVRGDAFSVGASILAAANGRVGIGTSAPDASLHVSSPTPTAGGTPFQVSSGTAAGQELLVVKGDGKIGFGTSAPSSALSFGSDSTINTLTGDLNLNPAGNLATVKEFFANGNIRHNLSTDFGIIVMGNQHMRLYTNDTERMRIQSDGNTGIGTTQPSSRLHLSGGDLQVGDATASTVSASGFLTLANLSGAPATAPGRVYYDSTGDGALKVRLNSGGFVSLATGAINSGTLLSKAGDFMTGQLTLSGSTLTVVGAAGIGAANLSAGTLVVRSTSTTATNPVLNVQSNSGGELMRVQQDGNVGIGTTNPLDPLHIRTPNVTRLRLDGGVNQGESLEFYEGATQVGYLQTAGDFGAELATTINQPITLVTNNTARMTIAAGGDVGVGTTGPSARLHVSSETPTAAGTPFLVSSGTAAGQELLVIKGDGKVGMGTTSPAARLHVSSGTLRIDGNAATAMTADGKVGIGTTGPQQPLHVNTPIGSPSTLLLSMSDNTTQPDGDAGIEFNYGGGGAKMARIVSKLVSGGGADLLFQSPTGSGGNPYSTKLRIYRDGDIQVMAGLLQIQPAAGNHYSLVISSQDGSYVMVADKAGRLGVGTTSPSARLHLSGGDLQVGDAAASTVSASGFLTLANLSGAPATAPGRVYYDSTGDGALKVRLNSGGFVSLATGTVGGGSFVQKTGDDMSGQLTLSGSSLTVVNTAASDSYSFAVTTAPDRSVYHLRVATTGLTLFGSPAEFSDTLEFSGKFRRKGNTASGNNQHTHIHLGTGGGTASGGLNNGYVTISGGLNNSAQESYAAIAGGHDNTVTANSYRGAIGGGNNNTVSGREGTVSGGTYNTAGGGDYPVVAGGSNNVASGIASSVLGGISNQATGNYSTVLGGYVNRATANFSLAAGRNAKAAAIGSFVWGDSQSPDVTSNIQDQFKVRAQGGFVVESSSVHFVNNTSTSMVLLATGNLGIGTALPSSRLHLSGGDLQVGDATASTVSASGFLTLANLSGAPATAPGRLYYDSTGDGALKVRLNSGGFVSLATGTVGGSGFVQTTGDTMTGQLTLSGSTLTVGGNAFSVGSSTLVVANGRVGIGTTNPGYPLHVTGRIVSDDQGTYKDASLQSTGADGRATFAAGPNWGSDGAMIHAVGNSNAWGSYQGALIHRAGNAAAPNDQDNQIIFQKYDGTNLAVIEQGGDVGIGTTNPAYKLHITHSAAYGMQIDKGGAQKLILGAGSPEVLANGDDLYLATDTGYNVRVNPDKHILLNPGSNVGIGTTAPTAKLHLSTTGVSAATDVVLVTTAAASASQVLVIKGDGKVGIGLTNPGSRLDVNGAATIQAGSIASALVSNQGSSGRLFMSAAAPQITFEETDQGSDNKVMMLRAEDQYVKYAALNDAGSSISADNILVVNRSGNVGIGTSSPNYRLDVSGGGLMVRSSMTLAGISAPPVSASGQGSLYFDSSDNKLKVSENGGGYANLLPAGGAVSKDGDSMSGQLTLSGSSLTIVGAAGIGAADLSAGTLVVRSTSTTATNPVLNVQNNSGGELLRIQQNGNVGIGTTSPPVQNLHVRGAVDAFLRLESAGSNQNAEYQIKTLLQETGFGSNIQNIGSVFEIYDRTDSLSRMVIDTEGRLGLGVISPTAKLHLSTTGVSAATSVVIVATGTASASEVLVVKGDGKVGIGTTDPNYALTIQGNGLRLTDGITANPDEIALLPDTSNNKVRIAASYFGGGNFPDIHMETGGLPRLAILSTGEVGIGSTSPTRRFQVHNASVDNHMYVSGGGPSVRLGNDSTYASRTNEVVLGLATAADHWITGSVAGDGILYVSPVGGGAGKSLIFGAGADPTERMRIDKTSNVGIGATSPSAKLHVSSATPTSDGTVLLVSSGIASGQELLVVKGDGKIGIGIPNPSDRLDLTLLNGSGIQRVARFLAGVNGDGNGSEIGVGSSQTIAALVRGIQRTANGGDFAIATVSGGSAGERMRVLSGGDVGIGTSDPSTRLHVSGGDLQVGGATASTVSASGFLTLANLSGAPATAPGRVYYDSTGDGALKVRLNSGGFVSLATGTVGGGDFVQRTGDSMNGQLTLSGSTLTVGGNAFSVGASSLVVANGLVGIGTTNPNKAGLVIEKSVGLTNALFGTTYPLAIGTNHPHLAFNGYHDGSGFIYGTNGFLSVWQMDPTAGVMKLRTAPSGTAGSLSTVTDVFGINQDGNVGVGTTSPSAKLHVSSATPTSGGTPFLVSSGTAAGQELLVVKGDGKVGVGTTSPQSTLHVPDGKYAQFEDNNAGAPPAADCDADAERGRMSIDTTGNLLYICNGATRGWDSIALSD